MSLASPLKKDVEKAQKDLDLLQRFYNIYFQGGEEEPPNRERKLLNELIEKIKQQVATCTNAGDRFQANGLISKFKTMTGKWDITLRNIETGKIKRPKKRRT